MRRITFARSRIRRSARPCDRVIRSSARRCRSWPSSPALCGFADRVKNCMRVRRRNCQDNRARHDSHAGRADHTGSFQFSVFGFSPPVLGSFKWETCGPVSTQLDQEDVSPLACILTTRRSKHAIRPPGLRGACLPCSTYCSSTPAHAKRLAPFSSARLAPSPDSPLTHFASPRGEKCRLES